MTIRNGSNTNIWIYEPGRDMTRLTFESGRDIAPVLSPDGQWIVYTSERGKAGVGNLYRQRSDGTSAAQRLTDSSNTQIPHSFDPRGKYLAYTELHPDTLQDIVILPFERDTTSAAKVGTPIPFLRTASIETGAMFSPDGRWIAYMSSESGSIEVYVRPFPARDGKWKVSTGLGTQPEWSTARQELFYLFPGPQMTVMVVPYTVEGNTFQAGLPQRWAPQGIMPTRGTERPYDVHPDGRRIVMKRPPEMTAPRDSVVMVFDFFEALRHAVAPK
jgi:hypothetical protein